jgi:hypothetical protein
VVVGLDGNWLDEAWKDMLIQETDGAIEFFMPDLAVGPLSVSTFVGHSRISPAISETVGLISRHHMEA